MTFMTSMSFPTIFYNVIRIEASRLVFYVKIKKKKKIKPSHFAADVPDTLAAH